MNNKAVCLDFMYLYPDTITKPFDRVSFKNKFPFEYCAYLKQQFNFFKRQKEQSEGKK